MLKETTCHTFLKFTIPLVKIVLVIFKQCLAGEASFKKGTQLQGSNKTKTPPINKRCLLIKR